MTNPIQHHNTRDIVCPHCGHVDEDSWELARGDECTDIECECGWCFKPFLASRHISVTYSTEIPK